MKNVSNKLDKKLYTIFKWILILTPFVFSVIAVLISASNTNSAVQLTDLIDELNRWTGQIPYQFMYTPLYNFFNLVFNGSFGGIFRILVVQVVWYITIEFLFLIIKIILLLPKMLNNFFDNNL